MMDIHPQVLQGKGRTHRLLIQFERVWLYVISQQKKLCTSHMGLSLMSGAQLFGSWQVRCLHFLYVLSLQ